MNRLTIWTVATLLALPMAATAATPTEKCVADKEKAAGKYSLCRMVAESRFAKSADPVKLAIWMNRCEQRLEKSFEKADTNYGVECPTVADHGIVDAFVTETSDQMVAYLSAGSPPLGAGFCGEDTVFDLGSSRCVPEFVCGNGVFEPEEDCEVDWSAGQVIDLGGTCTSEGFDAGEIACGQGCSYDTAGCRFQTCGDGFADPPEECDGADLAGETCTSLGFGEGTLACSPGCTFHTSPCPPTNAGSCGILFDQTSFDTVGFPDDPAWDVGSSGVTVELWFNPLDFTLGGTSHILFQTYPTHYKIGIAGGNQINFVTTSLTPANDAVAVYSFPANSWTHIAVVWDGLEKRVYVNGVNSGAIAASGSITGVTGAGLSHGSHPVLGVIDEVRVSSVARYDADFTPASRLVPDSNTVGLWHFDECDGTLGEDDGPNGLDAVVSPNRTWYGGSQP